MESRVAVDLAHAIVPLTGTAGGNEALFEIVGDAHVVLIGEATHGTHEFYRARIEITKRLIAERGFTLVCVESDWPDAYRVNRYVRGAPGDGEAVESLGGFTRFPAWLWRNGEVLDFVAWLREYNDRMPSLRKPKAGFYGLDLYSLYASVEAVIEYFDRVDPNAAARARRRYACLEPFDEPQPLCHDAVIDRLLEIQRQASHDARLDGQVAADQCFYAEQNARIVAHAHEYYRAMIDESKSIWNLRNRHMMDTLQRLISHLSARQGVAKAVVWAHNSHVGNAEATSMSLRGETNVGALAKQAFGTDAVSIGFTTYSGTVTSASDWHAPAARKRIVPARGDSYEYLFHSLRVPRFLLPLRNHRPKLGGLPAQARERAIGVVYLPQSELYSHYLTARIITQFDAVFHFDATRALEPLERSERWLAGEDPETYPQGV